MLTGIVLYTVLVFPFENLSNDRNLDWIGEGIAELMIERLQSEPGIYVFPREQRLGAYEKLAIPESTMISRATAMKLGWDMGADGIVTGRFSGTPDHFQISARILNLELSAASEEMKVNGKLEDVIPLANALARAVIGKLAPASSTPEADYTTHPPIPRSAFENYIRGILSSDPQKRVEFLQTAIRLHPQYMPAIFQLGRSFHVERNFKASNQWLEKIPEGIPERLQARFTMGLNYFYSGDFARAAAVFHGLPQNYDVLLNLGSSLWQKGDAPAAIATWKLAADLDPLSSDAFFNIGYASLAKGDLDAAVKNLNESLKLRGRDSEALFLLARANERLGRFEESQRLVAQATRLSQRVERWANQPLPKLERVSASTVFPARNEIWTNHRLARRAKGQDVAGWIEAIQNYMDSYMYGEAIRELRDLLRVFPNSVEGRSLLEEVNQRRNSR